LVGQTELTVGANPLVLPPLIMPGSVVNAASFQGSLCDGAIISIFGERLADRLVAASSLPFPLEMGGAAVVLAADIFLPLVFVSPNQINAVLHFGILTPRIGLAVERTGPDSRTLHSPSVEITLPRAAPAVFTLDQTGRGQGAILNQNNSVNGVNSPCARGEVVSVFCTGLGPMTPQVAAGHVAPATRLQLPIVATISGIASEILYAGAAPGLAAGAYQVNMRVPSSVPSGQAQLQLNVDGISSPAVILNVRA
jgi:uncharacterized protein (TIGR03437 family)